MQVVIQSFGSALKIKDGMFYIAHKDGQQIIPYDKVNSFLISKGVNLSSDAIIVCIELNIELLIIDRKGFPIGRVWSNKFGSISTIRKVQLEFAKDSRGTFLILDCIKQKMQNQEAMLLCLCKPDGSTDGMLAIGIEKIKKYRLKLDVLITKTPQEMGPTLRGLEGNASKVYFQLISKHLPEQYRFEKRSQHPAEDMFNGLLNYAYGILYSKVESAMIKAGIDPAIGIHHRDEYNKPVFVYDIIEKYRVWADNVVINLCVQEVFFIEFFDIENKGYYLNNEGKRILIQAINDYFEEVIILSGLSRNRFNHIDFDMQQLSSKLKESF